MMHGRRVSLCSVFAPYPFVDYVGPWLSDGAYRWAERRALARVVCRWLGYKTGWHQPLLTFAAPTGQPMPLFTNRLLCTGNERSLNECQVMDELTPKNTSDQFICGRGEYYCSGANFTTDSPVLGTCKYEAGTGHGMVFKCSTGKLLRDKSTLAGLQG